MPTFQTKLQHGDRHITLNETYVPSTLATCMGAHRGQTHHVDLARSMIGHGNLDMYVGVTENSRNNHTVNVTLDLSRNKTAVRDMRLVAGFTRVSEFFTKVPLPAAGPGRTLPVPTTPDEVRHDTQRANTPRPCLIGNVFRAIGDAIGFVFDAIWAGVRWCGRRVQSIF